MFRIMQLTVKTATRFIWRLSRNVLCITSITRKLLYPRGKLASRFGRGDSEYAWNVFLHHADMLMHNEFSGARRIMEVGPGRNIGTSLLWWSHESARVSSTVDVTVVLWDVYRNAEVSRDAWMNCAADLLENRPKDAFVNDKMFDLLCKIAHGDIVPNIEYAVCSYSELLHSCRGNGFDLIYSHAALEHAWFIKETWDSLSQLTSEGGWFSHRIDLADHGRRESNYIEMLEWPEFAYWLTMRFIPGAVNRWRAMDHIAYLKQCGFRILNVEREIRARLPQTKSVLATPFRDMDELELRTTAVDIVARRAANPNAN